MGKISDAVQVSERLSCVAENDTSRYPADVKLLCRDAASAINNALDRVDELEADGDRVATEFEKDLSAGIRCLLNGLGFEWDVDGATADQQCQFIRDTIADLERKGTPARAATKVELEAALAPFAAFAEWGDDIMTEFTNDRRRIKSPGMLAGAPDDQVLLHLTPSCPPITVGDMRRARKVWSGEAAARIRQVENGTHAKLSDCVNRLETIRETHPDIHLDDDIASARAVLANARGNDDA